jgi:O-antigen/teichoic acid export membrane protein
LGPEYLPGVGVVRIVVLSVLPYLLFVTLRSVLDSIEERAVNAVNLYSAVAVTVIASVLLGRRFEAEGLAAAMAIGFLLLGTMTFRAVHHRYAFALQTLMTPHVLALNAGLFLAALAVQAAVTSRSLPAVPTAVAAETVFALLYGLVLWRLGARWMREIARRVDMGTA